MEFGNLNIAKQYADEARKLYQFAADADTPEEQRAAAIDAANQKWAEAEKYQNLHCAQSLFDENYEREAPSAFRDMLVESARRADMHPAQRFLRDTVDFFDDRLAPLVRSFSLVGGLLFLGWLAGCWTVTVGQTCA